MIRKSLRPMVAASLFAAVLMQTPAMAATGIVSFTLGSNFAGFSTDETVGWSFSVAAGPGVNVSSLGWWDATPADPLAASHQVGLWTSTGTLLGTATVQTGDALTGDFRYATLATPITLSGGMTYIIGGRDLIADGDNYASANSGLTMGAGITFGQAARTDAAAGFAFPGVLTANSGGRFGPNFQYTPAAAIPEPSTYLMMALGLGAMFGIARHKRAASADSADSA
jgi:hypothetical protein